MLSADVEYWIRCIDTFRLREKINDRPVLIWGAYSKAGSVCRALEERGIRVNGYIDGHKEIDAYRGKPVCKPLDVLTGETENYIVVAVEGVRNEIKGYLENGKYKKDEDYFCFSEHTPDVTVSSLTGEYRDIYGNLFLYEGEGRIDANIRCVGGGNTVVIGKSFVGKQLTLNLSYGGSVRLGGFFSSVGECLIDVSMGGTVSIGSNFSMMKDSQIRAKYEGNVCIGDYVSCGERLHITSGRVSKVEIGNDCMFSHDITILGTNSHSIIDLEHKENRAANNEKPVRIGNHVWLGKGCTVIYGTEVGNGSIAGTQSVLKGAYPSECIIAGNVAKVIRRACTWDRRRDISYDEMR